MAVRKIRINEGVGTVSKSGLRLSLRQLLEFVNPHTSIIVVDNDNRRLISDYAKSILQGTNPEILAMLVVVNSIINDRNGIYVQIDVEYDDVASDLGLD